MANKGVFFIPDVEHDGDVQYYKSLVLDNGGEIIKVAWSGEEDDDAYIVFTAPTKQQVDNIKTILENG